MADQDPQIADNPDEGILSQIPEKFRRDSVEESVAAMANSYSEAERRVTELSSHTKALEDNYASLTSQFEEWQQAQTAPAQPDPSEAQAQLYAMYENDPISTMALLAQQAAQNAVQQTMQQNQPNTDAQTAALQELVAANTVQSMRQTHDDFAAYEQQVSEILSTNPLFQQVDDTNPQQMRTALETAYQLAKATTSPATPGYDTTAAKLAAQTATGGNPRPEPAQPDPWQQVVNAPMKTYAELRGSN